MPARDRYRTRPAASYDAVVIGAGIGGLVATALLTAKGRRVLCVDGHYTVGGCVSAFRRPGYEFDVGLHYIGDCGPRGVIPSILERIGVSDVEFLRLPTDAAEVLWFGGETLRVPAGYDQYQQALTDRFPTERGAISSYCELVRSIGGSINPFASASASSSDVPSMDGLMRVAKMTFAEFAADAHMSRELVAHLCASSLNYALPPSKVSITFHAAIAAHYAISGGYYPRGGGGALSRRIAAQIEEQGGTISLSNRALSIIVEGGRAVGVALESRNFGKMEVRAATVISNADYMKTMRGLVGLEHVGPKELRIATTGEPAAGMGTLCLGVERSALQSDLPSSTYWVWQHHDMERIYRLARENAFDPEPGLCITIPTAKDPGAAHLAPPGIVNVQIMVVLPGHPAAWGLPATVDFGDSSYRQDPAYRKRKAAVIATIVELADRAFPGLKKGVRFAELSTPISQIRYTDASGGTPYGLAMTPEQSGPRRPKASTSIRGLFVCGASARHGPGVMPAMLSGYEAALRSLERGVGMPLVPSP